MELFLKPIKVINNQSKSFLIKNFVSLFLIYSIDCIKKKENNRSKMVATLNQKCHNAKNQKNN